MFSTGEAAGDGGLAAGLFARPKRPEEAGGGRAESVLDFTL